MNSMHLKVKVLIEDEKGKLRTTSGFLASINSNQSCYNFVESVINTITVNLMNNPLFNIEMLKLLSELREETPKE